MNLAVTFHQGGLTSDERKVAAEAQLERLGLASCADLRAGTDIKEEVAFAGISGGQRRRLSLAVAIAKKPAVLIADEPTSGLDAAAAAAIMQLLFELSHDDRVAVVCTIHQPPVSVYANISSVLLLSKGRTAYYGPSEGMRSYFASLGRALPTGASVSEHALK